MKCNILKVLCNMSFIYRYQIVLAIPLLPSTSQCVGQLGSIRLPPVRKPIPDEEDKTSISFCRVPFTEHDGTIPFFSPCEIKRRVKIIGHYLVLLLVKPKFLRFTGVCKGAAQSGLMYLKSLQQCGVKRE